MKGPEVLLTVDLVDRQPMSDTQRRVWNEALAVLSRLMWELDCGRIVFDREGPCVDVKVFGRAAG
jgi:hypothetical protein